jgi:hypothetical protein
MAALRSGRSRPHKGLKHQSVYEPSVAPTEHDYLVPALSGAGAQYFPQADSRNGVVSPTCPVALMVSLHARQTFHSTEIRNLVAWKAYYRAPFLYHVSTFSCSIGVALVMSASSNSRARSLIVVPNAATCCVSK